MKMPVYAVCFDLNTKLMKDDGLTKSEQTLIYSKAKDLFGACGLKKHQQYSMYATEDTEEAFNLILKLPAKLKSQAQDFCKYLSRFDVVKIEDSANIVDLFQQ
jgi:virulence-associated protein VapD